MELFETSRGVSLMPILRSLAASVLLLLAAPIIILFSILIVLESKGSPLFLQSRIGLQGKEFYVIKLRSMQINAERSGPQWALSKDERVTKVGRIIRRMRIDELPQLLNVIKGDMSLIGPRPERACFIERFYRENASTIQRLRVKPGLTGWAQVNGGYDLTFYEKLELDLFYIENRSLTLDMRILWKTIKVVVGGKGAR